MASHPDLAEAFSRHRFAETFPSLRADVRWRLIGAATIEGRDAVIEMCASTTKELQDHVTRFHAFRVIDAGDVVVVESEAVYGEKAGTSRVASCDVYEFVDGELGVITSYSVELPAKS